MSQDNPLPEKIRSLTRDWAEQFAKQLADLVEQEVIRRIISAAKPEGTGIIEHAPQLAEAAKPVKPEIRRRYPLCYFPNCKNVAAPRFGMFCAEKHKELPKKDKLKYRQARDEKAKANRRATRAAARNKARQDPTPDATDTAAVH